ncbi:MAG: hypothetical protein Q7K42_03845 [Candidatus Diapherotrites archaeon]|nr:hypothetical protein [Candidatus Diapherotrites archaeon]
METITVNRQAILDLFKVKEEFDTIIESLELMSNKKFMDSYKKAKQQIEKREFADWNDL